MLITKKDVEKAKVAVGPEDELHPLLFTQESTLPPKNARSLFIDNFLSSHDRRYMKLLAQYEKVVYN